MRKGIHYNFMFTLVSLTGIVSDFICFAVTNCKIKTYEHLIHYRTLRVTSSYRQANGLGKFFLSVVVSLIIGTTNTPQGICQEVNLSAISQIESSSNPKAIGDGGKALGLFQLHNEVIQDYNHAHNTHFSHRIALDSKKSRLIADWYLNRRIPQLIAFYAKKHPYMVDSVESRLTAYNMGILAVINQKTASRYVETYRRLAHV